MPQTLVNPALRINVIASGEDYQHAAAWAASTYARCQDHVRTVSVLVPEQDALLDTLQQLSQKFGFLIERFPFKPVSDQKFTSQLKCQGYHFCVSRLRQNELLFLVDADTCCFKPITVSPEVSSAIHAGKIGMVTDIADRHFRSPSDVWYLTEQERLPYVNSGVILTALTALDLFEKFYQLSEQPEFLRGPFNDQKVINFALGKYFREKLVVLDKVYNHIGSSFEADTIIGHFAGGAGYLARQPRKDQHQNICAKLLHEPEI